MAPGKKHVRQARRMQTRTKTKGTKHAVLSDPTTNNALLSQQLHGLGLYAVETLGDGNCLFRALSDQLYGTPNYHFMLRSDICDWIEQHKERYEPFVEDDRGINVHLRNMRELGTYGGHLELSAFAHLRRRNVKVIQPGLVYVIEWEGGESRESRRWKGKSKVSEVESSDDEGETVYIAYHDWEHFSSIRNISGPHQGSPHVVEAPQPSSLSLPTRPKNTIKLRGPKLHGVSSVTLLDPSTIPLPRSPSPSSQDSSRLTSTSTSSLLTPDDAFQTQHSTLTIRQHRSPKRTIEESEIDIFTDDQPYSDKKHKSDQDQVAADIASTYLDLEDDQLSELSSLPSTPARALSPPSTRTPPSTGERPLTRRQRKALGLPKPRGPTAGKIIIPGGRHPKRQGKGWVIVSEDETDSNSKEEKEQEWVKNGTGRVDVRGFKELRI